MVGFAVSLSEAGFNAFCGRFIKAKSREFEPLA
jgi:hypothetical protein